MNNFSKKLFDTRVEVERENLTEQDDCNINDHDLLNLCGGMPIDSAMRLRVKVVQSCVYEVDVFCDVYYVNRTINCNNWEIANNTMIVRNKGNGIGTTLFLNQVISARAIGFKKINVFATGPGNDYTGHRHWGRLGFSLSGQEQSVFLEWCNGLKFTQENLFELLKNKDGYRLWSEMGFSWYGTFLLNNDSINMQWLREYCILLKERGLTPPEV